MPSSNSKPESSHYESLPLCEESEGSGEGRKKSFSSEDDHSVPLLEAVDNSALAQAKLFQLQKFILCLSFVLTLLSAVNIALLPTTLSEYQAHPLSDHELKSLPYGDARIGLDKVAELTPPHPMYHRALPDRIARVSRKLKNAVWGHGVQVYITVEDSTIMRFPIPSTGIQTCALSWRPPPDFSVRAKDLTTKGDITEIEIWQLIMPSATISSDIHELDYDTLSYSTLPVRGELLGVLDLTERPNSTTSEFSCPTGVGSLVVEMRCQRVACHVSYMQINIAPFFGFELVRSTA